MGKRKIMEEDVDDIIDYFINGMSITKISEKYNCSASAIRKYIDRRDKNIRQMKKKCIYKYNYINGRSVVLKLCGGCGAYKELNEFQKDNKNKHGAYYYCKVCNKIKQKIRFKNNKNNKNYKMLKDKHRKIYNNKNKHRRAAYNIAYLKYGSPLKWCAKCNDWEGDYKPLDMFLEQRIDGVITRYKYCIVCAEKGIKVLTKILK